MTPLDWKTLAMVTRDMPPFASVSQMAPFFAVAVRVSPSTVFSIALPPPALIRSLRGTALLAGGLLAFALSFDEVIVTIFTSGAQQTLPIWIFATLSRPDDLPVVNVVALFVIVVSLIPVYLATRLAGPSGLTSGRPARGAVAASVEVEP